MPLIKNGVLVGDLWVKVGGEAPIPANGDVIVEADRLLEDGGELARHDGRIGVLLANDEDPMGLSKWIEKLALIALDFPQFTDGRAFSQARVLRHRLGFDGELRALGNVLVDQAAFMTRCGIDAFEVWGEQDLAAWQRIMGSVTRVYQPGYRASELGLIGRRTEFSRS